MQKYDENTIKRLTILKYCLGEVQNNFSNIFNKYAIAIGISTLHICIDNLFWTIAELCDINFSSNKNQSITEELSKLLEDKSLYNKITLNKSNLSNFCRIRNNFVHGSTLSDSEQSLGQAKRIINDIETTVKNIFDVNINQISLSQIIQNKKVKNKIQAVEISIDQNSQEDVKKYKQNLHDIGKIYFDFYGLYHTGRAKDYAQCSKIERYRFDNRNVNQVAIDLLELDISPFTYYRFKNLVPDFGIDISKSDNQIVEYDQSYWGDTNWTKQNTQFCLNWLINYILSKERLAKDLNYKLQFILRYHIIKPDKKININVNQNQCDMKRFLDKDKDYLCTFFDYIEGRWQNYTEKKEFAFLLWNSKGSHLCRISLEAAKNIKIIEISSDIYPDSQYESELYKNGDVLLKNEKE